MDLPNQYKKLLDNSFRAHYPGWDSMSPMDPTKVLAESIASSLSSIEKQQRRMLDTVLESMPALFSVQPKKARLPIGLFSLRPSHHLRSPIELSVESPMRLQSAKSSSHLFPMAKTKLYPILDFKSSPAGISFQVNGPMDALSLYFTPNKELAEATQITEIECLLKGKRGLETLTLANLIVAEETDGFTQQGNFSLARKNGQPLFEAETEVDLKLAFSTPLEGDFLPNLVPFIIGKRVAQVPLGFISGVPWEKVSLPEELVCSPETLTLQLPDGRALTLKRMADEILRLCGTTSREESGFFYQGSHHCVVIPNADTLVGEFEGGVQVFGNDCLSVPDNDWSQEKASVVLGDSARFIEEAKPYTLLQSREPRESGDAYLSRFYGLLRDFQGDAQRSATMVPSDIQNRLLSQEPELKAVEIKQEGLEVTAYCLSQVPQRKSVFRIERPLSQRLQQILGKILPLSYTYGVAAFEKKVVRIDVQVRFPSIASAISREELETRLEQAAEKMVLSPPFGALDLDNLITKEEIRVGMLEELPEVSSFEIKIRNDQGQYLSQIQRKTGECVIPTIQLDQVKYDKR